MGKSERVYKYLHFESNASITSATLDPADIPFLPTLTSGIKYMRNISQTKILHMA